jgi:hypothetical protein
MYASSVTHYHTFIYQKSSQYLQADIELRIKLTFRSGPIIFGRDMALGL